MVIIKKIWAFFGLFYLGAFFLGLIGLFLKGKFKKLFAWFIVSHLFILSGFFAFRSITFQLKDFSSSFRRVKESLVAKEMPYEGFQPELLRRAVEIIPESANVIIWRPGGTFELYRANYFLYPRIVYDTKFRQVGDYIVSFSYDPKEASPSSELIYSAENIGFIYKVTKPDKPDVR